MVKAVIFDMDGVIVNSEPIESLALEKLLEEHGSIPILNNNGLIHIPGVVSDEYWKLLFSRYRFNASREVLRVRKHEFFEKIVKQGIVPMEGVVSLLQKLKRKNIKLGVASSRFTEHVLLLLDSLQIKDYFDAIISPADNIRVKPFPDLYLEAARKLHVDPAFCVAIEDTETGVASAKTAGMKVVAIPNRYTENQDFSKADKIVKSLTKINISVLENL